MKNILILLFVSTTALFGQSNVTVLNGLYFSQSGNATDGLPYARFTEAWGIRYASPDTRWAFSTKPSLVVGYLPTGQDWGSDNVLVAGKVGVGVTTAAAKLHISSTLERETFRLYRDGNTANYLSFWQGTGGAVIDPIGTGQLYLGYDQATNVYMGNGTGKIGIGTTSPNSKLVVSDGTNAMSMNPGIASGFGFNRNVSDGAIFNSSISAWQFSSRDDRFTLEGHNGPPHDLFTVLKNGNVGIGTITPGSYKLAVEGKIGAREVNVTTNAWSDYVFNADYKLPPLAEVQQYIEENHHLPEVPSEKEVLANGQNLGEMNAILLKKIEELTLYVIDLKRENESMKTRLEKIENQNK